MPRKLPVWRHPLLCVKTSLTFFIEKVNSIRAQISPLAYDPSISVHCSAVFDHFEPATFSFLQEVVGHLKPSGSPNDAVPPRLFKEVFPHHRTICCCSHKKQSDLRCGP